MHMQIVNGKIINVVIYENPLVTIAYTKQRERVRLDGHQLPRASMDGVCLPFTSSLATNPLNGKGNGLKDEMVAVLCDAPRPTGWIFCSGDISCGHTRTIWEVLLVCNPFNSLVRCKFIGH